MDLASCLKFLTQRSELKGGFLLLGFVSPVFNVFGLCLLFGLGLKLLQLTWQGKGFIQFLCEIRGKSDDRKCGFCLKKGLGNVCESKMISCQCNSLKCLENSKSINKGNLMVTEEPVNSNGDSIDEDDDDFGRQYCVEDEESDVIALSRLVKIERHRAEMAYAELEKERVASASAADEAMGMILRLQNEKSSTDIEANRYRRLAEQQQEYDQEVIQSLQWIIMKLESERTVLEEKLRLYEQRLEKYMKGDEIDQFEGSDDTSLNLDVNSTMENGFEDVQTNSIENNFSLFGIGQRKTLGIDTRELICGMDFLSLAFCSDCKFYIILFSDAISHYIIVFTTKCSQTNSTVCFT